MPMDPKKLIKRFSWKCSQSAVFSHLHKIHFADIWLVSAYTVTYMQTIVLNTQSANTNGINIIMLLSIKKLTSLHPVAH